MLTCLAKVNNGTLQIVTLQEHLAADIAHSTLDRHDKPLIGRYICNSITLQHCLKVTQVCSLLTRYTVSMPQRSRGAGVQ